MKTQLSFDHVKQLKPSSHDGLRPYQEEAVAAALSALHESRKRIIIKLPTGAGKTRTAIALVRRWLSVNTGDNALWLANRTFLVEDAIDRLRGSLGGHISREQAAMRASDTRMTVGSMQTFVGRRLAAMDPNRYGLVICDECQFMDSPGGLAIMDHFKRAAFVGLSATPGDAEAFGGTGAIVYKRDILWSIDNGFFVPIAPRYEQVVELDIADVRSVDGDLQIGALEKKVAAAAVPIAKISYRVCGDRQTIIYTPGVASGYAVVGWLNSQRPDCAVMVDAKTPPRLRRQILSNFHAGKIQYMVNCGIFLFGLDVPTCSAIVIARMTEDRDLWEQMVGRGGRPAAGIGQIEDVARRRSAILESSKPNMLLLVLSGEHGKHSLCDIGDLDEEATIEQRAYAASKAREPKDDNEPATVTDALRDARAWQAKENDRILRAMELARLRSVAGEFNPFAKATKTKRDPNAPSWTQEPATTAQRWWLRSHGLDDDVTKGRASQVRGRFEMWKKNGCVGDWKRDRIPGEDDE